MAAAKQWGDAQFDRLDKLTVGLPHPDATAAIISGGTEVTAHFATPPFWNQELAGNPKAHKILSSYDVLGGPGSSTLLFATTRFRQEHRKSFDAFLDALQDRSEEHTSELQSLMRISYAVFCLKKKKQLTRNLRPYTELRSKLMHVIPYVLPRICMIHICYYL